MIISFLETCCLLASFGLSLIGLKTCFVLSLLQQHGNCVMIRDGQKYIKILYILIQNTLDVNIFEETVKRNTLCILESKDVRFLKGI